MNQYAGLKGAVEAFWHTLEAGGSVLDAGTAYACGKNQQDLTFRLHGYVSQRGPSKL